MEDNEFEEVTIISHTDQGATILPQRTAERLMKDIRLEVTQKISQTENIKMGSLKDSEASTMLDKIQPMLDPVGVNNFCVARKLENKKHRLLLGSTAKFFLLDTKEQLIQEIYVPSHTVEDSSSDDEYQAVNLCHIVRWYDHHYIFKLAGPIEVFDLEFKHVRTLEDQQFKYAFNRYVHTDKDHQIGRA